MLSVIQGVINLGVIGTMYDDGYYQLLPDTERRNNVTAVLRIVKQAMSH